MISKKIWFARKRPPAPAPKYNFNLAIEQWKNGLFWNHKKVSYVELQQKYLNYAGFQGNLNVTVRFAHPSAWDVRDYEARASLIGGKNWENFRFPVISVGNWKSI